MIYLDNSATTAISREVYEAMIPYLTSEFGNPSSKYYPHATVAKDAVEESRYWVAKLIHAKPEEIIFTAGSTESSNMIIKGVADYQKYYENKGNHIITSLVEHHATLNTCKFLNGDIYSNQDATFSLSGESRKVNRGFEVTFLGVNQYAQVVLSDFEQAIKPNTVLASVIWANNEIGSINDVKGLADIAHQHGIFLHIDGTQIIGKLPVDLEKTEIDFLSLSAHKFHGPKGIGAAYIRGDDYGLPPISAYMHGGEQENGLRAGTLSVHNIVGFGKAAELACIHIEQEEKSLWRLDKQVRDMIAQYNKLELLGDPQQHLPGIFSVVVHDNDFNNERFIRSMSEKFALSTGSACTAGMPSHVLKAIGRDEDVSRVLRISLCADDTPQAVNALLENLD